MNKSAPTQVLFLCTFPPGANLEYEGLGRYFGSLFNAATEIEDDFQFTIVTFPWHRKWAESVSENTILRVESYVPKSLRGIALLIWSFRRLGLPEIKNGIRFRMLNKQALIYNIHLLSAGILPQSINSNFLYRLSLPILKFVAKSLLYLSNKIFKKNRLSYEIGLEGSGNELVVRKQRNFRRAIFDLGMKKSFDSLVKKYSKNNPVLLTMNNRYEIKNYSRNAMLVPDVIPLTERNLFESGDLRWKVIIREIERACLSSANWITFSKSTQKAAINAGVLTSNTAVTVIPHASVPPGAAYTDFKIIESRGLERQWVDYHWRAGQVKVINQLFKAHTFNQNLKYIIFPTQLRPHKNIEMLIESWQGVVRAYPEYKLVLTLDILKHSELQIMVRELGLSNSVIFVPGLSDSELIAWQSRARFVISTSGVEGAMPFMVSESIAVGVPFLLPLLMVTKEILPKSVLDISELRIDSSKSLTDSLVSAIPQRDAIQKIQKDWSVEYSRSWGEVWNQWIIAIERISKL